MVTRRGIVLVIALTALLVAAAVPALAHERKDVGEWQVIFGMTPEPVFTDQFYKTTWRFRNADGTPVTGLQNLFVTILLDGKPYGPFAVQPAHGDPGLYEVPTIFAEAGEYRFILTGNGPAGEEDRSFDVEFTKDVLDASVITIGG